MEAELNRLSEIDTEDGTKIGKLLQHFAYNGPLILFEYVILEQNLPILCIDTDIDMLNIYT